MEPLAQPGEVVYGIHSVHALVKRHPARVRRLHIDDAAKRRFGVILRLARRANIAIEQSSADKLGALCRSSRHQGIVAECSPHADAPDIEDLIEGLRQQESAPLLLILDRINDPQNLGACLRSASAFGCDAVLLTRHHSCGLTPVVRKVAAGAAESLEIITIGSLHHALDLLRERLATQILASVSASVPGSRAPYQLDLRQAGIALIVGGEQGGVRASAIEAADSAVHIPMTDEMECLNAAAACTALLYEVHRQRAPPA